MGFTLGWDKSWTKGWDTGFVAKRDSSNPVSGGLQAWYDFSNANYLTLSATAITQALDRSGNGNHTAVQGTGTARPTFSTNQLNGLPTATFDGGDTLAPPAALYAITNGDSTVFAVSKINAETAARHNVLYLANGASGTYTLRYAITASRIEFQSNTDFSVNTLNGITSTSYQLFTATHNAASLLVHIHNGANGAGGVGANTTSDRMYIGSRQGSAEFLTGGIGELLIYNRALTTVEATQVETYLGNKWGL